MYYHTIGRMLLKKALLLLFMLSLSACSGGGDEASPSTSAFRWDVNLEALQLPACFQPDTQLPLIVAAYNRNGEPVSNLRYEVTSEVPGAIEPNGTGGWMVRGEGATTITVTYMGETDPAAMITPVTFDVLRDGTAPQIAVHQPARGSMVISDSNVRIQGLASDTTSPIQSLTVNGEEQVTTAALKQMIDVTPPGSWGMNVIEVAATDSCDNTATLSQSYLRSQTYRPAATTASTAARVARGQSLRLTQAAVDDNNRADIDDFATLMERYLERNLSGKLAQLSSGQVISNQTAGCPGVGYNLSVAAAGATVIGPHVQALTLQSGNIQESLSLERVTVPLRLSQTTRIGIPLTGCTTTTVNFSATLSASLTSDSTSVETVAGSGQINVTMPSVAVQLADVQLTLTGADTIDNILSSLLSLMTDYVEITIEDLIRAQIPPLLEELLNTPLTASTTISGGPFSTTLSAVAGIDGIQVIPAATTETAYTQIHPASTGTPYPALGAIARPTVAANLTANPGPVTYAIDDNLINQGLWALWHSGAMEIPDVIGFSGVALRVSALLPPVLMPGAQQDSVFGIGDLKVTLTIDQLPGTQPPILGEVQVEAYASHVFDGRIEYDNGTRALHLQAAPDQRRTYVHVTRLASGTDDITDATVRAEIETYAEQIISRATTQLADDTLVSIILPPLRFQLDEPAVGGTVEALELQITALARTADHLVIDLSLKAEEPPDALLDGALTLNEPWTQLDLLDLNIPPDFWNSTTHVEDPNATLVPARSTTVLNYRRTTRPQCDSAGNSPSGDPICLPQWQFPLNYGWYCGAGRPVVGFTENPILDPVDYCCLLHDRQIWAEGPDLKTDPIGHADAQARNACGVVMCLSQSSGYPTDIASRLPDVERARRQMYNKASIICGPNVQPELPAAEIVSPQ